MEYIKNYFNNQLVTKIKNDNDVSYYICHVEHDVSSIFIVVCNRDDNELHSTKSIGRLNLIQIMLKDSKKPWKDVQTVFSLRKCKGFIIDDMWCSQVEKKPYENSIVFELNETSIRIVANVKNKDTSIFFTKQIKLRTLLETFEYELHFS